MSFFEYDGNRGNNTNRQNNSGGFNYYDGDDEYRQTNNNSFRQNTGGFGRENFSRNLDNGYGDYNNHHNRNYNNKLNSQRDFDYDEEGYDDEDEYEYEYEDYEYEDDEYEDYPQRNSFRNNVSLGSYNSGTRNNYYNNDNEDAEEIYDEEVKKKKPIAGIVGFLFILVAFIIGASLAYSYASTDKRPDPSQIKVDPKKAINIKVPKGARTDEIASILKKNGVIDNEFIFKVMSKLQGYDGTYKAGTHQVMKGMDYAEIMTLLSAQPMTVKVTIPEGLAYVQVKERLKKAMGDTFNEAEFDKASDPTVYEYQFLKDIPKRQFALEGYLFPDTYEFNLAEDPKDIMKKMLDKFEQVLSSNGYYKRAEEMNTSIDKIIIMASLIEKESSLPGERKKIAGVFYNRLKSTSNITMGKLETDPTLNYIHILKGEPTKQVLTDVDKAQESPYNTYKYAGLPPGPICNPGMDSIEAALYPEQHDFYFFVAKGDGSHVFARTIEEQNANIINYLRKQQEQQNQ